MDAITLTGLTKTYGALTAVFEDVGGKLKQPVVH